MNEQIYIKIASSFAYILLLIAFVFAVWRYIQAAKKPGEANYFILQFIPGLFTTLGIFGTFIGIAISLYFFDTNNIEKSVPAFLSGMKTAFVTSVVGIALSVLFSFWIKVLLKKHGGEFPVPESEETRVLKELVKETKSNSSLVLSMIHKLDETKTALVASDSQSSTFLLEEIRKTNLQLVHSAEQAAKNSTTMVNTLNRNHELMVERFNEFAKLLASANTDALREAMESLVNDFNETFKNLITGLVNQNFDELNISVRNLNTWQQNYRGTIEMLVGQLGGITNNMDVLIHSIHESQRNTETHLVNVKGTLMGVAEHTQELVSSEGQLEKIVNALRVTLVEEDKLITVFKDAQASMERLLYATTSFEEIQSKITKWLESEVKIAGAMTLFNAGIAELTERLKELDGIKMENLQLLDNSFNTRLQGALDTSFANLDNLMREYIKFLEDNRTIEIKLNPKDK